MKATRDGYGFTVDAVVAPFGGYLRFRVALPSEYLTRIDVTRELWGDDVRFEGLSPSAGIVTSQPAIHGDIPDAAGIETFFIGEGFVRVPADKIANDHIAHTTWFHPAAGVLVSDAKPDNFVRDDEGNIVPIDVITCVARPDGDLDRILR
ncbi:MAG: hypothetical protein WDN28_02200 [Chthoniobacter sp.]